MPGSCTASSHWAAGFLLFFFTPDFPRSSRDFRFDFFVLGLAGRRSTGSRSDAGRSTGGGRLAPGGKSLSDTAADVPAAGRFIATPFALITVQASRRSFFLSSRRATSPLGPATTDHAHRSQMRAQNNKPQEQKNLSIKSYRLHTSNNNMARLRASGYHWTCWDVSPWCQRWRFHFSELSLGSSIQRFLT